MTDKRYRQYLEDREESAPSGRYTERLAQERTLSPLAKAGIAAGALGLVVIGLRSEYGQELLSSLGRRITDQSALSGLESDIAEGYYTSLDFYRQIQREMSREKVYDHLHSRQLSNVAEALLNFERTREGFDVVTNIHSSKIRDVLEGFSDESLGAPIEEILRGIRDVSVLTDEELSTARQQFSLHMQRMREAVHLRYDQEEQGWFGNMLLKMSGLRRMTLGDVVEGRADYDVHDVGPLRYLRYDRDKGQTLAGSYRPKSSVPGDEGKEWLQLRLERMVRQDPETADLAMGKGLYMTASGQSVDLRGIGQFGDKAHDFLSDFGIPIIGISPYKILRIDEIRAARDAPLFEFFSKYERDYFQPVISSQERGWEIRQSLVKYGKNIFSLDALDKDPLYTDMYSSPGIRTVLSRMLTRMSGVRDTGSTWGDLGTRDQPSITTRLWSKFIDDSSIRNQPETIRALYGTEESRGSLDTVHKIYTDWLDKSTGPLDSRSYELIEGYVRDIYGEAYNLETPEGILEALQKVAEHTSAKKIESSVLYGDKLKGLWYSYQKNPFEFLRRVEETDGYSVKKALHKEFFAQIDIHAAQRGISLERLDQNISVLQDVFDRSQISWFSRKSVDDAQALLYSYVTEREGSTLLEKSPLTITGLLSGSSLGSQGYKKLSEEVHSRLNPVWNIVGLGGPYPERELYNRSSRILMRQAIAPWKDPVGSIKQLFAGRESPESITTLTAPLYWTGMRLNEMLGQFGLGLSNRHLGSVGQMYGNLFLRRYLPAMVGLQALRYLSFEVGNLTGTSLEEMGANIGAHVHRDTASIRDSLGLTERFKKWASIRPGSTDLIRGLPGGTMLDPTMSREEVDEYIRGGDVEVRRGRWWPLGNTPFQGGAVSHYRPNYYRRVAAQPTMTGVLHGSEEEYWANHWMPTPRYPAAPIRHYITDPYHYEKKHHKSRPYLLSGGFPEIREIPLIGPIANRILSAILKPQEEMHKDQWSKLREKEEIKKQTVYAEVLSDKDSSQRLDQWGLKAIGAPKARGSTIPRRASIVAVLDTGVSSEHPDLQGRVLTEYGYNPIEESRDTEDRQGHGTHVSGIIAGSGQEGSGVVGVAADSYILPIKVLGDSGTGSIEDIIKGIDYAIDWEGPHGERVDVINMSLGSPYRSSLYGDAVKRARKSGITVVAAGGNLPINVGDPAFWADVVAVGAVDRHKKIAPFSARGEDLDIVAPGVDVISTVPATSRGFLGLGPREVVGYDRIPMSGTSMASPHVAAAAAILKSQNPELTPEEVMYLLYSTAEDLGETGWDPLYGHGLVRTDLAVQKEQELSKYDRQRLREQAAKVGISIEMKRREQLKQFRKSAEAALYASAQIVDPYEREYIDPRRISHVLDVTRRQATDIAGLYGWILDEMTGGRQVDQSRIIAESRAMTSERRRFWDAEIGGLGMGPTYELNEYIRRSIGRSEKWGQRYNPIPNLMPSWMPGEDHYIDFRIGDPYIKIASGEERLPGAGYEALHDVPSARMRMRGSGIGRSVEDMVKYLTHTEEESPDYIKRVMDEGTRIHDLIQEQWMESGFAESIEGKIYHPEYDITGHYDAILRQPYGREVSDIKTLSVKRFEEITKRKRPFQDHLEQVNFYMGVLGIDRGSVYYVQRTDLSKEKWFHFGFDPKLYEHSLRKVSTARAIVQDMIDKGVISPYETYDKFERFKILADVAPYSDQYKYYEKQVREDDSIRFQYGREDEYQKIKAQVEEKKRGLRLYPYMFKDAEVTKERVTIDRFIAPTTFVTREHPDTPITLAAVQVNRYDQEGAEAVRDLIQPGMKITIGYDPDPLKRYSDDYLKSIKAVAYREKPFRKQLENINKQLIEKGYESRKDDDSSATIYAKYTPQEIAAGSRWESFSHMDTPFHTKFSQIRSPLESYKRRDLYGKDFQEWSIKGTVKPTLESWSAGSPLYVGGLTFLLGTTMSKHNKLRSGAILGGMGLALTLLRSINETTKGKRWIPKRRRKERAIDEYFDKLEYLKYRGLYEASRRRILEEEGYDIEEEHKKIDEFNRSKKQRLAKLYEEKKKIILDGKYDYTDQIEAENEEIKRKARGKEGLGKRRYKRKLAELNKEIKKVARERKTFKPTSALSKTALEYRDKYTSTLYGLDPEGPRYKIYRALPSKDRKYLEDFLRAKEEEREEILELIPENQRKIYQSKWGMEVDEDEELHDYFSSHYLPHPGWEGWSPDKSLKDIKVRVAQSEAVDLAELGLWDEDVRRSEYHNAPLINMRTPNYVGSDLRSKLKAVLEGEGLEDVVVSFHPMSSPGVSVQMEVDKDRREEIEEYVRKNDLSAII